MNHIHNEKRYLNKLLVVLFVNVTAICSVVEAEVIEKILPITMTIDNIEYPSSLYLRCKVYDFNGVQFTGFKDGNDPIRKEFKQLFLSIKNNDANSFRSFGKNYHGEFHNDYTAKADRNLAGLRGLLQSYGEYGDGLKIYYQLLIGKGGMFIWGCDINKSKSRSFTQRRALNYEVTPFGQIRWNSAADVLDPLTSIVTHTLQEASQNPTAFKKKMEESINLDHTIPIPGTEDKDVAYLQFNGKKYDIDVMHENVPNDDKVLRFYQEAYLAWRDLSTLDFAQYYTAESRERLLKGWEENPDLLTNYKKSATFSRVVLFIMDANPFYVVFYTTRKGAEVLPEYVVVDPSDGQLRLTNLGVVDLTTQYFLSDEFHLILNRVAPDVFPIQAPNIK
jgi:hypothetical protein